MEGPQLRIGHYGDIGYSERLNKDGVKVIYARAGFREYDGIS
ncbi:hypothetical protein [Arthrobacter sp. N199823]|nr:hypothetical protein [Arthrobacter sp. N199823]